MNTTTETKGANRGQSQARAQLESIVEMVKALEAADAGDDENAKDEARQTIQEDPLSVEVRTDWYMPGNKHEGSPAFYRILLCWGGPACQIIGELSEHGEPGTAEIQGQDWGTPWETLRGLTGEQEKALLTYSQQFYFGE